MMIEPDAMTEYDRAFISHIFGMACAEKKYVQIKNESVFSVFVDFVLYRRSCIIRLIHSLVYHTQTSTSCYRYRAALFFRWLYFESIVKAAFW